MILNRLLNINNYYFVIIHILLFINSGNILVTSDFDAKITDFGTTRFVPGNEKQMMTGGIGTLEVSFFFFKRKPYIYICSHFDNMNSLWHLKLCHILYIQPKQMFIVLQFVCYHVIY